MNRLFFMTISFFGFFSHIVMAAPAVPESKKFEGVDLSIEGETQKSVFSRVSFKNGKIIFLGREYKILSTSRHGVVGAGYIGNNQNIQEYLVFTSSYMKPIASGTSNPWLAADSYNDCINTNYNTVVVLYDVLGSKIVDRRKQPIDLKKTSDVKKKLFAALARTVDNSTSATGYCRTIE